MELSRSQVRELADQLVETDDSLQVVLDSLGFVPYGLGYSNFEHGDPIERGGDGELLSNVRRDLAEVAGVRQHPETGIWRRVKRKRRAACRK